MKSKIGLIIIIALFVAALCGLSVVYEKISQKEQPETVLLQSTDKNSETEESDAVEAPDFTVLDDKGTTVKLSDFKGRAVVLNFWASWCGPCKNEMPHFDNLFEQYGDDVQFMMVNLTDGGQETLEKAKNYISSQGYSFPVFYDTSSDAAFKYNTTSIPVTYFIDEQGNIVTMARGAINAPTLEKGINMILK